MSRIFDWRHVDVRGPDECWPWLGYFDRRGYGKARINGTQTTAHRCAYIATHGPIAPGIHACHTCDNPPCCNPAHLWLGTPGENTADSFDKGRRHAPFEGASHPRPCAKVTERQVKQARALWAKGRLTRAAIAERIGLGERATSAIIAGQSWKHLL